MSSHLLKHPSLEDSDSGSHTKAAKRPKQLSPLDPLEKQISELVESHQDIVEHLMSCIRSDLLDECPKIYAPFFMDLCKLLVGHDEIPLPLGDTWAEYICYAALINKEVKALIKYIEKQDGDRKVKKTQQQNNQIQKVVVEAWKTKYIGNAHILLGDAIDIARPDKHAKEYGNFFAIIQGSGTGKSRTVDKLADIVFTIPFVVRDTKDKTGYPRADEVDHDSVLAHLSVKSGESALYVQRKQLLILLKCLEYARNWIIENRDTIKPEEIIPKWRALLENQNERRKLHQYAVSLETMERFKNIQTELYDNLKPEVAKYAAEVVGLLPESAYKSKLGPYILFYFDEAHTLTTDRKTTEEDSTKSRTAYQCLCKALGYFTGGPIFALFISTYSRLSEYTPSARHFWSYRGQDPDTTDALHPPFVELPFDMWTDPILVRENVHKMSEISSLKFMARFGRPLFWAIMERGNASDAMRIAMEKLTLEREDQLPLEKVFGYKIHDPNLLPLLALRIDLTFESNRDEAVYLDGLLVASSMRTVYSVPKHRQYLRGGYPSEPFLAEAASRVLYKHLYQRSLEKLGKEDPSFEEIYPTLESLYKETLPATINAWSSSGLISKGERGELVTRLLFTLAHDLAVIRKAVSEHLPLSDMSFSRPVSVVDFLKSLISPDYIDIVLDAEPQNMPGEPLREAFKNAYVCFTHFAKGGDNFVVTDDAAMGFFSRIAAVQGHATLDSIDLLIYICFWDKVLNRWIMSLMAVQIKNRLRKQRIHIDLEDKFQFFSDRNGIPDQRPYITIAMELGVVSPQFLPKPKPANAAPKKSAGSAKTSSQGKKGQKGRPSTPPPSDVPPSHFSTPSKVKVPTPKTRFPKARKVKKRKGNNHPRYEIRITGCSPSVYNVVASKVDYMSLLAHTDLFSEHPRQGKNFLDAIKQMKPTFDQMVSYDFIGVTTPSRIGATLPAHAMAVDLPEMVRIGEMGDDRIEVGRYDDDDDEDEDGGEESEEE